jgi:hypothetical protein
LNLSVSYRPCSEGLPRGNTDFVYIADEAGLAWFDWAPHDAAEAEAAFDHAGCRADGPQPSGWRDEFDGDPWIYHSEIGMEKRKVAARALPVERADVLELSIHRKRIHRASDLECQPQPLQVHGLWELARFGWGFDRAIWSLSNDPID